MKMIFLLLVFVLISCGGADYKKLREEEHAKFGVIDGHSNDEFYVIVIDSCEYVVYSGSRVGGIVHKANCRNHK
jgi:hypothetical protein